jgi:hypothetical protein
MTPSLNLYVSQQTTTGTLFVLAIIATIAVPALEYTAPLEKRACAPTSTMVTSGSSEGRAGSKAYVQGMGFGPRVNDFSNSLPRKRLSVAVDEQRQKKFNLLVKALNQQPLPRISCRPLVPRVKPFPPQTIVRMSE